MASEKPRRRWFQFSLRTLFVLVTLAGVASPFIPQGIAWLFPPTEEDYSAVFAAAASLNSKPAANQLYLHVGPTYVDPSWGANDGFHVSKKRPDKTVVAAQIEERDELPSPPPPLNIDHSATLNYR